MKRFLVTYADANGFECTTEVQAEDGGSAWEEFIKDRAYANVLKVEELA